MSITVVIARDDVGAPSTREVYALGARFTVENGDLSIITAKPQVVALYGSGNWLSVHVDDHVEVISERPAEDSSDFGGFGSDDSSFSFDTDSSDSGSEFSFDTDSSDSTSEFSFDTDSSNAGDGATADDASTDTDGGEFDLSAFEGFGDDADAAESDEPKV